ncbi:hypothetical protein KO505_14565 [Psychrosphaera sp. F3M07]|jgi:hypothetical protein|uniref:hypothetical protein n=1 Tax=Psychrosphaera sp. F3M07 TaxID=2841560 RepID=UPI001C082708|nr:hypothetical protein [Psychrosphaera sp. F3M07]MBU2919167.1 hypothetical protein [Psychrosphaera sp. F3M07]
MKTLFTAALFTLVSTQTFAQNSEYKFVALDNSEATDICLTAATVGYYKAKKIAKSSPLFNEVEFITTKCNGLSIRQFAKKYTEVANTTEEVINTVSYEFKPVDNDEASQLCAVAAKEGLREAINIGGRDAKFITCNGLRIETFARKFRNS